MEGWCVGVINGRKESIQESLYEVRGGGPLVLTQALKTDPSQVLKYREAQSSLTCTLNWAYKSYIQPLNLSFRTENSVHL